MNRTVVTARIDYDSANYANDFDPTIGWFDMDKATRYDDGRYWDGSNTRGNCSRSQWVREYLFLTAGGRWVHNIDSTSLQQGDAYHFMTADEARDWLVRSEANEAALAEHFPTMPDESGPTMGRPAIGEQISVAMPAELLARIDASAEQANLSRSAWIRWACEDGLR